jgi:hypothetical protein
MQSRTQQSLGSRNESGASAASTALKINRTSINSYV